VFTHFFKKSQFEQSANIKFCFKLRKTAAETLEYLKTVYGDEALKKTAVYDWFKRFKNGQESLEDEERSGQPSTSKNDETIEKVKNLVQSDRRLRI
jgi:histone-lysine N-methyltransferase SETMAR